MSTVRRTMCEVSGNVSTKPIIWNSEEQETPGWTSPHLNKVRQRQFEQSARSGERKPDSGIPSVAATGPRTSDWISTISNFPDSAPAVMLNELHQAYSEIEKRIFTSKPSSRRPPLTTNTDDLQYSLSHEVLSRWETGIAFISQQYLEGATSPEAFEATLTRILVGVERLERAKEKLEDSLEDELQKCGIDVAVPNFFWASMEECCRSLEKAFMELENKLDQKAGRD